LITHFNFRAGGILEDSRFNGVIVGAGKGDLRLIYLPVDADIKLGEKVYTSGLSRIFPEGIAVGEVKSVNKSPSGLYKVARIRHYADLYSEEELLCVF
jgi:rod shape-determining protein MreC